MKDISTKFGLPQSLLDTVRQVQKEETEYQAKVKALMKKKGISSLGQLSPEEKKKFFSQLDAMHTSKNEEVEEACWDGYKQEGLKKKGDKMVPNCVPEASSPAQQAAIAIDMKKKGIKPKNEETEIDEGKSGTGYELYHKDFSSAMAHAYDFAKKKYNIEVDPMEIDRYVAAGPKKPSSGKANAYRLLDKTGKKAIQVQVTNLDNKRYELNMYKEDVELDERLIKGKGYDSEDNESKPLSGNVPTTSLKAGHDENKAKAAAAKAKGKLVKGIAQSHKANRNSMWNREETEHTGTEQIDEVGDTPAGKKALNKYVSKAIADKSKDRSKGLRKATSRLYKDDYYGKKNEEINGDVEEGVMQPKHTNPGLEALLAKKRAEKAKAANNKNKNEEAQIEEGFSDAQIAKLKAEYSKINTIDPSGDAYKKLTAMLDKLDKPTLEKLAGAGVKFVSGLARNRVNRMKNEAQEYKTGGKPLEKKFEKAFSKMGVKANVKIKTVGNVSINENDNEDNDDMEVKGKKKPVKKGETVSGKKEPVTIDPEMDDKN